MFIFVGLLFMLAAGGEWLLGCVAGTTHSDPIATGRRHEDAGCISWLREAAILGHPCIASHAGIPVVPS